MSKKPKPPSNATEFSRAPKPIEKSSLPIAAAMSFLKDTRGVIAWTSHDLAETLNIHVRDAKQVIPILEMQGYIRPAEAKGEWLTTIAGETVSRSASPRFTRESVDAALEALKERIKQLNRDTSKPFKVMKAVAFGDFLSGRAQVQAADIGILIERRNRKNGDDKDHDAEQAIRNLRKRSSILHLRQYEDWMASRTHKNLT